jgi:hypothetical protein
LNTKPLDILWSTRDGSISIEFMLQAKWRNKTFRSLERFSPYRIHPWHWASTMARIPLLSRLRTRGDIPPAHTSFIYA